MSYHNFKEYKCPVCEKDFKKPRQLKQHLSSHAPTSPSCCGCPECKRECMFLMEAVMPVCANTKCKLFGVYITAKIQREYEIEFKW